MRFNFAFATDVGRKRKQNQDNGAACPDLGLFVVADGMGGHRGGETASAISAEVIPQVVRDTQGSGAEWDPRELMKRALQSANKAIFQRGLNEPGLQGMGTTTTALLFHDNQLTIGHVGDSRCYYFRPNAVWQITRDHSLVQEKLRAGLITRAQLKTDTMKNVITRSVGFESEVSVEIYQMAVQPGDIFLICSDGLSGLIEDSEVLEKIQKLLIEGHDIRKTVEQLIEAANANGGDDNITSVVIQILPGAAA